MNNLRQTMASLLIGAVASTGLGVADTATAQAQTTRRPVYRNNTNNARTEQLIRRIETGAERFRGSLDQALDNSRYDGTNSEDNINSTLDDFNHVIDHLRERYDRRLLVSADVDAVLVRAARIDTFVRNNRLSVGAKRDWAALRVDLNELGRTYNVAMRNDDSNTSFPTYPPVDNSGNAGGYTYDRGLTGTYRLNVAQSENARAEVDRVTRTLPYNQRRRAADELMARLEAPDALAIERRGNTITIASTRAPQISFEADGSERTERNTSGDDVRARASFYGDQLIVSTTGDRNSDFSVTFDPLDNGRRLQVTRRISSANLNAPIVVRSVYTRTADVAQFDIYRGGGNYNAGSNNYPNGTNNNYPGGVNTTADGDFVIPNGTTVVATLNSDLTTERAREGDRFALSVREPSQYAGATIEGTLGKIERSGKVSGRSQVAFNFDRIRLRDGRSYRFAGFVESVRTANGESVRVDNEGTVQDKDNRTNTTAQRAAIGTAVGAIIGAIAGGGKGAAIGAVLGAGGGAGSVYVQGADDLQLLSGTELTIRSSGPNNR